MAALTLAPTFFGRVGYLQIERALAARIQPLHQHGVPGEAEYIRRFGMAAPFVHGHCHADEMSSDAETPVQLALSSLLFGSVDQPGESLRPWAPAERAVFTSGGARCPQGIVSQPATPPPQPAV